MEDAHPPEPKPSWVARLLALGNDNKLVAAATLITIATGLPYLVGSLVKTLRGEDESEAIRTLFAEALMDSARLLREQAEEQQLVYLRSEIKTMVANQFAGLETVRDQAIREGATDEERDRLLDAVNQWNLGLPQAALEEIARIAEAQQARGALEDAAETWRKRAALQITADGRSAIRDYRHAETIHPGDAAATLMLGLLLSDYEDADIAYPVFVDAVARARTESDPELLGKALFWLTLSINKTSPAWTEERGRERTNAAREASELFFGVVKEDPAKSEAVALFSATIGQLAFGDSIRTPEDAAPLLQSIGEVERIAVTAKPSDGESVEMASARLQLASAKGSLLFVSDRRSEALDSWETVAAIVNESLPRGRRNNRFLETAWNALYPALEMVLADEVIDWAAAETLAQASVAIIQTAEEYQSDNPAVVRALVRATYKLGLAQSRLGKLVEAENNGARALSISRAARSQFPDDAPLWEFRALVAAAQIAQAASPESALETAEAAHRFYGEVVVPGPFEEWVEPELVTLNALLAELRESPGGG